MGRPSVRTDDPRKPCLPRLPEIRKEVESRVEGELPGRHSGLGTQWLQPLMGNKLHLFFLPPTLSLISCCPVPSPEATKGSLWWGLHSQGRERAASADHTLEKQGQEAAGILRTILLERMPISSLWCLCFVF